MPVWHLPRLHGDTVLPMLRRKTRTKTSPQERQRSAKMAEAEKEPRVTLRLSPTTKKALEDIKELGDFKTIQEAVRRSIGDELFLQKQQKAGWTVLLKKGNEYRELVWPNPT
jgi:hypothetical protein